VKVIDLQDSELTLPEALRMADDDLIVLRRPDGTAYALSHVDDFAVEAELLKHNPEFLRLMNEFSNEEATISLEDLRRELSL
jgi:hypothetical protein